MEEMDIEKTTRMKRKKKGMILQEKEKKVIKRSKETEEKAKEKNDKLGREKEEWKM